MAEELKVVAYIEHHKGGDNLEWEQPGGKHSALTDHAVATATIASLREELEAKKAALAMCMGMLLGTGYKASMTMEMAEWAMSHLPADDGKLFPEIIDAAMKEPR
jgi:hypothetical protein